MKGNKTVGLALFLLVIAGLVCRTSVVVFRTKRVSTPIVTKVAAIGNPMMATENIVIGNFPVDAESQVFKCSDIVLGEGHRNSSFRDWTPLIRTFTLRRQHSKYHLTCINRKVRLLSPNEQFISNMDDYIPCRSSARIDEMHGVFVLGDMCF